MSCPLVPIIPFLPEFSFLAATGKQWENSLPIQLKATETTRCQIEKLKQKPFFHTEVPPLQRKNYKNMYCIPFDDNKAKTSG